MNTVINVYGKAIEFDTELLKLYEKTTTNTLEEAAPYFVAATYNEAAGFDKNRLNEIISSKTSEELKEAIMAWVKADFRCYGVTYGDS